MNAVSSAAHPDPETAATAVASAPPARSGRGRRRAAPTTAPPGVASPTGAATATAAVPAAPARPPGVRFEQVLADPRDVRPNPRNPRHAAGGAPADPAADAALLASVRAVGVLQPPAVRRDPADDALEIVWGDRRRWAAAEAGTGPITFLLLKGDPGAAWEGMAALSENLVRQAMNPVALWAAASRLLSPGDGSEPWSEAAVCAALSLTPRRLGALLLLARLHPPIRDRIALGDMPAEAHLKIIAAATPEEQAAAWKRLGPKRGAPVFGPAPSPEEEDEDAPRDWRAHDARRAARGHWPNMARALRKTRVPASLARFSDADAERFGVRWEEDLFAPEGTDGRHTTDADGFLAAQKAWLNTNLPKGAVRLEADADGYPRLPKGAYRVHADDGRKPPRGAKLGVLVCPRTGAVLEVPFMPPAPPPRPEAATRGGAGGGGAGAGGTAEAAPEYDALARPPRPALTDKGRTLVGRMRTDALRAALADEAAHPLGDLELVALLVLALGAANVTVGAAGLPTEGLRFGGRRLSSYAPLRDLARHVVVPDGGPDGETRAALATDPALVRSAARTALAAVLSCSTERNGSGPVALVAGDALRADARLPTMATEEFLSCLSKAALELQAAGARVNPRPTGRATRAAMVAEMAGRTWVYPPARFAPDEAELAAVLPPPAGEGDEEDERDGEEPDVAEAGEADAEAGAEPGATD